MAEVAECPKCHRPLQVPPSFFGQIVQCPECAHQFEASPPATAVQTAPSTPAAASERPRRPRDDDYDDEDDDIDFEQLRRVRHHGVPHRGGIILAMGILALVIFPYSTLICGPIAWIMGSIDLAKIRAGEMDPSGEGMVQAGRVLGIISTVLGLGVAALVCFFFAFVVAAG